MTPFPSLTPPPAAPSRSDPPETFITKADAWVAWMITFRNELAQFADYDESIFVTRDGSGRVGLGTSTPGTVLEVSFSDAGTAQPAVILSNGGVNTVGSGVELRFYPNTSRETRCATIASVQEVLTSADLRFYTANGATPAERLRITRTGVIQPGGDNTQTLGAGSFRWSVVYAATGTINTSDAREKEWRGGLTAAELRAAKRIAGELGFYRWLAAIAEKGDAARYHFGARAQQVWGIMADEGLVDPIVNNLPGSTPYAFLCFDKWDGSPEVPAVDEVVDEDGKVITSARPAIPARDAGSLFGLRVDQLSLFLIAAQEQRLAALEAMS